MGIGVLGERSNRFHAKTIIILLATGREKKYKT